jgi:hypothetical protein
MSTDKNEMTLDKIINLFESRHTCELSDRHGAAILKLAKEYQLTNKAFCYKHIPQLSHVISLTYKAIITHGKV